MSVLFIVEPKCTLAASHAAPVTHGEFADRTYGRTPDRYITLSARHIRRNKKVGAFQRSVSQSLK